MKLKSHSFFLSLPLYFYCTNKSYLKKIGNFLFLHYFFNIFYYCMLCVFCGHFCVCFKHENYMKILIILKWKSELRLAAKKFHYEQNVLNRKFLLKIKFVLENKFYKWKALKTFSNPKFSCSFVFKTFSW